MVQLLRLLKLQRLVLSAWFLVPFAAPESPNSGPVSDPDAPGDSPYNPLPYGHPYPGLGPYQQPFQERVKIVYVESRQPQQLVAATRRRQQRRQSAILLRPVTPSSRSPRQTVPWRKSRGRRKFVDLEKLTGHARPSRSNT